MSQSLTVCVCHCCTLALETNDIHLATNYSDLMKVILHFI